MRRNQGNSPTGFPRSRNPETSPAHPKFSPSIFHYKCYGAYHASTDRHYGPEGVCRGIQSRMEHVRDLHPATREEAINVFCQAVDYPPEQQDSSQGEPHTHETLQALLQSQALIYDEETENLNQTDKKGTKMEEQVDSPWHDWDCYGSTDIHLLVLRDLKTKKENIVGVSPDCALGVSVRDVGTNQGGDTIATIRVGPLEVSLGNHYEFHDEPADTSRNAANKKDSLQKRQTHPAPTALAKDQEDYSRKVLNMAGKIVDNMKQNATILKDAVSEDFPSRVLDSSFRIVGQFGKTLDRTTKLMGTVLSMWRDDDDQDGN